MTRKFRFLGYGGRKPFEGEYSDMNHSTHYWYGDDEGYFVVGQMYEALYVNTYDWGYPSEARFVINDNLTLCQELQFFEEVFGDDAPEFDENWDKGLVEPSEEELLLMDMTCELLEYDLGLL